MSALGPQHVGLLGELRLERRYADSIFYPFYPILDQLLMRDSDLVLSRGPDHYRSLTIAEAIEDIMRQWGHLVLLDCRKVCTRLARYIMLDRILNRLVRISYAALRTGCSEPTTLNLYLWAKGCIDICVHHTVVAMHGPCDCSSVCSLPETPAISVEVGALLTRPILEMDNLPLIFWRAMSSKILLRPHQVLISPLLGGGLVAPLLAALQAGTLWNYVTVSLYDTNERDVIVAPGGPGAGNVILVDDNIGTANTLGLARGVLQERGLTVVGITAVEMHWEKFFKVRSGIVEGHTFHLADIDEISPYAYRHYATMSRLRQQYCMRVVNDSRTVADWILWSQQWLRKIRNAPWLTEDEHFQVTSLLPLFKNIRPIFTPLSQVSR